MIKTEIRKISGKPVEAVSITAPGGEGHPNMLVLVCEKGYMMCGYLNMDAAGSFGDAAAVISGSSIDELLANPVKAVSSEGEKLGLKTGMSGEEACRILNG